MTEKSDIDEMLAGLELSQGPNLLVAVKEMKRPALLARHSGRSSTWFVSGLRYHLGGVQDTRELAELVNLSSSIHVLDVCCFVCGPAVQLADTVGCTVTGVDLEAKALAQVPLE